MVIYRKKLEKLIENTEKKLNVNDTVNDTVKLNKTETMILNIISRNSQITQQKVANELNVSVLTIKRNINKLKEKGLLVRIGADKNGCWKFIKNENK